MLSFTLSVPWEAGWGRSLSPPGPGAPGKEEGPRTGRGTPPSLVDFEQLIHAVARPQGVKIQIERTPMEEPDLKMRPREGLERCRHLLQFWGIDDLPFANPHESGGADTLSQPLISLSLHPTPPRGFFSSPPPVDCPRRLRLPAPPLPVSFSFTFLFLST